MDNKLGLQQSDQLCSAYNAITLHLIVVMGKLGRNMIEIRETGGFIIFFVHFFLH